MRRIGVLGFVIFGLFAVLLVRLWFLQVVGSEAYVERAEANRLRSVVLDPPRGRILDRNGSVIVANRRTTNVVARPRELTGERRDRVLRRLAPFLDVPYPELRRTVDSGDDTPYQSIVIAQDVSRLQSIALQERPRQFPGIAVADALVRDYRQTPGERPRAAHVVGYTGAISEEETDVYRARGYLGNERVGVAGIEARYELYLRGAPGELKVEVDADGQPTGRGVVSSVSARPGSDLQLSLDLPTQTALEQALREYMARSDGSHGAAGVALDPETGEVLALASFPTYDPGAFAEQRPKDVSRALRDPRTPLLNRAIAGRYPAASTYKIVSATAAIEEGFARPNEVLDSPGEVTLYGQTFANFGSRWHGPVTMSTALEVSSDTFFYQLADRFYRASPELPLQEWSRRYGFGEVSGVDIAGEEPGTVPTPEWKRRAFAGPSFGEIDRLWLPGDTIQLAIGQNFLEVTPIQLARAYAAVANGGTLVTPTLARAVLRADGRRERDLLAGRPVRPLGLSPESLQTLREGLELAANGSGGTATAVFGGLPQGARVAGKTGTAEVPPREDHSWFVGYAPVDNPRIVVAVIVENAGTGANAAAPVACQTITRYLRSDPGACGTGAAAN